MMAAKMYALIDYGPGPTETTASGVFHVGVYGPDGTETSTRYGEYRACIAYATRSGVARFDIDLTPNAQYAALRLYRSSDDDGGLAG